MKIVVTNLSEENGIWTVQMKVDDRTVSSEITIIRDGLLQGLNFVDQLVAALVTHCGMSKRFVHDFFTYIANSTPELPWTFDSINENAVRGVFNRHPRSSVQ